MAAFLFLCGISILVAVSFGDHDAQEFAESIVSFKEELLTLFCDGLSVGGSRCDSLGIQDFVNSFHSKFEQEPEDVSSTVRQITARIDNELNSRAAFMEMLAASINGSCSDYRSVGYLNAESLPDFEGLAFSGNADRAANLPSDMGFNSVYGRDVSLTASTFKIPNNVDFTEEHIQLDAKVCSLTLILWQISRMRTMRRYPR